VLESYYSNDPRVENFFAITLDIDNWDISIILADLNNWSWKSNNSLSLSLAGEIYVYLDTHVDKEVDWSESR
jgi:hypothetical protein